MEAKTVEQFVKEANKLWNNKYDYSRVIYVADGVAVEIICPDHGSFFQKPASHLTGRKCGKCSKTSVTTDIAIERSRKLYGDQFTYDEFQYTGIHNNVIVTCRIHGAFLIRPDNFWRGQGCKECNVLKSQKSTIRTTEQFIEAAQKIHGDRYDYSISEYKGSKTNIVIVCWEHGSFLQLAYSHLSGYNCPLCEKYSLLEKSKW